MTTIYLLKSYDTIDEYRDIKETTNLLAFTNKELANAFLNNLLTVLNNRPVNVSGYYLMTDIFPQYQYPTKTIPYDGFIIEPIELTEPHINMTPSS